MSADTFELLKNLLVLQHQAARTLVVEFHQQTEAYVQQFGRLPLSQQPAQAAHAAKIPLREAAVALSDGCAVSELLQQATRRHCDGDLCATSADHLAAFLETAWTDMKTAEDRVQALFVLEATLARARERPGPPSAEMLNRFESKRGYDLLIEWFAICCSYKDEASRAFTELLLVVLQRHEPTTQFTRKKVLRALSKYKKFLKGKNKELFKQVTQQYREAINA